MHSTSTCEHSRLMLTRLMLLWWSKIFRANEFLEGSTATFLWTLDRNPASRRSASHRPSVSITSSPHRHLPSFPSSVRITPFFLFLSGPSADSISFSRLIPVQGLELSARRRGKESPDAKMATYSKFTFERLQISEAEMPFMPPLAFGGRRSHEKVSARHENDRPSHST